MAEKTQEQIFTIPLRDAFGPGRLKRANVATRIVRRFLQKSTKTKDVKLGQSINKAIWARGIQKPPRNVRVHILKVDKTVYAELVGVDIKPPTTEEVKKKEAKITDKIKRIRESRKERRKESIQKELEAEKVAPESKELEVKEKPSEIAEKKPEKERPHEERAAEARKMV
ncbi:MAG: 50S ribosomal protein L31e [Candidatus Aenigmatarchaeota archaeon]|nr:60S ribosomal protein L31 [Candidatus Aenigmarchaeota archaeon]